VSFCGLYAMLSEDTAFVDVAIVLALVGFLATVALARFVERRVAQTGANASPKAKADTPTTQ
jgi:multicomponent Na+:H+ antiporter subunit F